MNAPIFLTVDFVAEVEQLVANNGLSYMDAMLEWCRRKNIEIETISTIVNSNSFLKAKLQLEAEKLHFLPKSIKISI